LIFDTIFSPVEFTTATLTIPWRCLSKDRAKFALAHGFCLSPTHGAKERAEGRRKSIYLNGQAEIK